MKRLILESFDDGLAAYVQKDYSTAACLFRSLGEQGHPMAQRILGSMYDNGRGVPQDYVQAHKWLDVAASQGDENAPNYRDIIAAKMTPADCPIVMVSMWNSTRMSLTIGQSAKVFLRQRWSSMQTFS